jgi:deazaflavin-dependent oxidoreductase (nitroreductase family)
LTTQARERPEWVRDHIERYQRTAGQDGHLWRDVTTLLLTTIGRRSGDPTTTPLIYGRAESSYVVVASSGGAPAHPLWYLNLSEHPEVEVQIVAERFKATARTAKPEEKLALWEMMAAIWPSYNRSQAKTARQIPVVVLDLLGGTT